MLEMPMSGETDLADDADRFGLGLDTRKNDTPAGVEHFDAVEALVEVEMPPGAAELAVGRELEAHLLLLSDDLLDFTVFDLGKLRIGDLLLGMLRARLLQRARAQQAADVIGAEWRRGALHAWPSTCCAITPGVIRGSPFKRRLGAKMVDHRVEPDDDAERLAAAERWLLLP